MHLRLEIFEQVQSLANRGREFLNQGREAEAVAVVEELLDLDPDEINVCIVGAAQLIDAGTALNDIELTKRGMALIERLLAEWTEQPEEKKIEFQYNLANGHANLYRHYRQSDPEQAQENLQQEKNILQAILLRRDHIPLGLEPAVLANYANVLDKLGRTSEAVDFYVDCLALEPTHGLAKGNCANAIRRIVAFSDRHQLSNVVAAWDLLSASVAQPAEVLEWAGLGALEHLRQTYELLRSEIDQGLEGGVAALEDYQKHREQAHCQPPAASWADRARQERLLLTFNQFPLDSEYEALDDAFFDSLTFGMEEEEKARSVELIHLFNAIKEDFVVARHLYFEAEVEEELLARNHMTIYGDPEGDVEFGLVSGVLKASFRIAVDLLDKVAVFMAVYFRLDDAVDRYNFNNVWFKGRNPKNGEIHPTLEKRLVDNYPLSGLRDLQRDFFRQEFPGPIKDARNAAVHRWLRLSWLPPAGESEAGTSWNMDDFRNLTLFALRQAKAATLLLAALVNVEERRKTSKKRLQVPLNLRKPISARAADDIESDWEPTSAQAGME